MLATPRILSMIVLLAGSVVTTGLQAQNATATPQAGQDTPHKGIGVAMQGDENGVAVVKIVAGSPAEKAGVKIGDKVVSIAGVPVFDFDPEKARIITDTAKTIAFVVMRGDQKMTFQIVPAMVTMPGGTQVEKSPE